MATKSPSRFHGKWPNVADPTKLPNVASTGTPQDAAVEVGDTCYSISDATLYTCTTATFGGAVWSSGGGGGGGGSYPAIHFPLSGVLVQQTTSASWVQAAIIRGLNFADIGIPFATIKFGAVLFWAGSGQFSARLYNVTDSEAVTGSNVVQMSAGLVEDKQSSAITVGASAGNLKNDGDRIYAVEISLPFGSGTGNLYDAYFLIG